MTSLLGVVVSTRIECRLLGPVEVLVDGRVVPLGGAKPRSLLVALLLARGAVVPVSRLIDVIWPQDPPGTARGVIQTYVRSLRRAFGVFGLPDLIVTRSPGYAANIPTDALDWVRFERLVAEGRAATSPPDRSRLLGAALALWRGPALAGLGDSALDDEAARLAELRITATEQRIAADIDLGRYAEVLGELTALLGRCPTDERLRGHQMVVLSRLGRRSDALASFRAARHVLVEELGVDPGPELTAIHHAVLRGDRSVLGDPVEPPGAAPAQVPAVAADFTGRRAEITALVRELRPRDDAWAPAVHVVTGPGGSGKSALAAWVAREVAGTFPGGQLYADLRGMTEQPAEPADVLARFLTALDAPRVPPGFEERVAAFRDLSARRRVLVVLDDAASERQVRPLLPTGAACAALVTSRHQLGGLAGAGLTRLDVLDRAEALDLLGRIVGQHRVSAECAAADDIVTRCGLLPLAIRIAGARLATRHRWPLRLLAERLGDQRRTLDELAIADLEVRASFGLSYHRLADRERIALRRLGFLGAPEFAPWVLAWALDVAEPEAEVVVERLVDANLVDFTRVDDLGCLRYRLHDLVRIYARERAEREEPPAELTGAVARTLSGWLSVTDLVTTSSPPDEVQWRRTPTPRRDVSAAVAKLVVTAPQTWFDLDQSALVAGVECAAALGLHDLVCEVASARMGSPFLGGDRYEARVRMISAALSAVRPVGNVRGEAILLAELGHVRYQQDRFAESARHQDRALGIFRDLGDEQGEAVALAGLGMACRESGRLLDALGFLDRAQVLFRSLGDDAGLASAARMAGSVRLECGDLASAWTDLETSLATYRRIGSRRGEALTLRSMGLHHRATGALTDSIDACTAAASIFRELEDELMVSYAVRAMAKAEFRLGRHDGIHGRLDWCLSVCRDLGDRHGQGLTLRTFGEFHLARGRPADAEEALTASLAIWDGMEAPLWRARTVRDLAEVHARRGEAGQAARLLADATRVFREHHAREYSEMTGTPL